MSMTREEAIGHLKNVAIYSVQDGYTDEARQALDMAIKALEEPQWIPCSVKYPEADERVLVTTVGYDYYVWDCMSNRSDSYFWEDESGFYHDKHEVIAWMPLPEPWRGDVE